jgi:uncharacterized membrane protein
MPGTFAGLVAAGLTALLGLWLGLLGGLGVTLLVAGAAFLGTLADSLLGALAPRLSNELTNVLCTLVAASLVSTLA